MQTKIELVEWIILRQKELIDLEYELIDSLNEPEIDSSVRAIRSHLHTFEDALGTIKNLLKEKN